MRKRETVINKLKGSKQLRKLLDAIPSKSSNDIALHSKHVEDLRKQCAHSIKCVEDAGGNRSDCFSYALEIPSKILIATDRIILVEFFSSPILKLLKESRKSIDGGLVVYFSDDKPKHIGVISNGRVVSKWGKNPAYNHALLEVPTAYGDKIRYYQKPPDRLITTSFIEFVRSHERYLDCKGAFEEWVDECGY